MGQSDVGHSRSRNVLPRLHLAARAEVQKFEVELRVEHDRLTRRFVRRPFWHIREDEAREHHLNWQLWEQKLSRYVFAVMPTEFTGRALGFAISIGMADEFRRPVIAKIVTSRIRLDPWLYDHPAVRGFLSTCLQELIKWEDLGWDMESWAYTPERWGVARRVLQCIRVVRDGSFSELVRSIRDHFISGAVTRHSGGDEFTDAEVTGVLEFMVKYLEVAAASTKP